MQVLVKRPAKYLSRSLFPLQNQLRGWTAQQPSSLCAFVAGRSITIHEYCQMAPDGGPVIASNGMSLNADAPLGDAADAGLVIVIAGFEPLATFNASIGHWLRAVLRARRASRWAA